MSISAESGDLVFKMLASLIGGLGIFLLGMKNMSEGMQAVAGNRLRKLIASVTNNRLSACGVGTAVTCLIQSSSVTTVMVVGFVSAGFMTLIQAIPVIMGANIGTTITGWILVLNVGKWGLPILGISAFFFLFSQNERVRYTGMTIMGIGMVFFGLQLMSSGFKPMRTMPEFHEWFTRFSADSFSGVIKCVSVGCLLTCIVQSSSATLGITMGLASTGVIQFESAAALVLGENIGTTITAYLASLGAPANAKRAAYAHIIFNVIGVCWIVIVFRPYLQIVSGIVEHMTGMLPSAVVMDGNEQTFPAVNQGIAFVHSGFNIINTILFLPFVSVLANIVTRLAPDKQKEAMPHLTFLDMKMIDAPAIGIQQSEDEISRMGDQVAEMMDMLTVAMSSKESDDTIVQKIFYREEVLDTVQKEVTEFLSHILSGNVTSDVIKRARVQLRLADEYESISDYIATILKLYLKKQSNKIWFTDVGWQEIMELQIKAREYIGLINTCFKEDAPDMLSKARSNGDALVAQVKLSRSNHLDRMSQPGSSPMASLIFTDMLTSYRRIRDHGLNIAESVAGEK